MNLNLTKNNLKIGFDESPILSVDISGNQMQVFILIVTVTSVHRIVLRHPKVNSVNPDGTPESILATVSREQICDPSSFYVISNDIGRRIPYFYVYFKIEYKLKFMLRSVPACHCCGLSHRIRYW